MARRHFTVSEVQQLIPTLERSFSQLLQLRAALRREEQKLEKLGLRISPELLSHGETPRIGVTSAAKRTTEPKSVQHAKAAFRGLWEALTEELESIEGLGGEIKDLDAGLVDFPSWRGDDEILLCWKLGEKTVGFWHSAESGFGGRQPIDDHLSAHLRALD